MVGKFVSFIKRKTSQKYKFNLQYEGKKWDSLRDLPELGRYSIIAGYVKYCCKNARILDLGCGEGIMAQKIDPSDYSWYQGIDFSDVAIESARKLAIEKSGFAVGDLNRLTVDENYDAIIYNESLYYLGNPQNAVRSLFKNLNDGGIFIISMVDKNGKEREGLWHQLGEILELVDKTKVINRAGDSWTVQVYRKK